MTTYSKNLVAGTLLTTSAASALYTVPANTRTRVNSAIAVNTSGTARLVTIYLIPSGGVVGDATTVTKTLSIPANDQRLLPWLTGQIIEAGGTINALADAATAVAFRVSGDEIS